MSDDLNNAHNSEVSFEPEDLTAGPIITALTGLGIACIAIYFVVLWMYHFLDRYQAQRQPVLSPLVTAQQDTRRVTSENIESFPQPRLETDERGQLDGIRIKEEERLNTYGWVDQNAGVVHIPIERAMQMLARQGLPTRESATAQSQTKVAPSAKKPKGE